jgi:hypothetical protein
MIFVSLLARRPYQGSRNNKEKTIVLYGSVLASIHGQKEILTLPADTAERLITLEGKETKH